MDFSLFVYNWKLFVNGSYLYWAIPIAIFAYLIDPRRKYRLPIGIGTALLFIFIYNPLMFAVLSKFVGSTVYRFFWILPGWAALAYLAYTVVGLIKPKYLQLALVFALSAGVIRWCYVNDEFVHTASNIYQIPMDTIVLADQMLEIMDERDMDFATVYGNYDAIATLRQYNARFRLRISPRAHFYMEDNKGETNYLGLGEDLTTGDIVIDPDFASDILNDNGVYFLILKRSLTTSRDYLNDLGWEEVCGTENFAVYCQDAGSYDLESETDE